MEKLNAQQPTAHRASIESSRVEKGQRSFNRILPDDFSRKSAEKSMEKSSYLGDNSLLRKTEPDRDDANSKHKAG